MLDFNRLFNPRAIGIIGVSDKPYGGGFFLRSLQSMPYDKPIYIFNPRLKGQIIRNLHVHGSILDIPMEEPIDHVIIAVPAKLCPTILEEVGKRKVPFVTIFTSGFSEVGKQSLESDILKIAIKYDIRIIGPNCLGIYVPKNNISFSSRLSSNSGNFGMILQSGGLAIQMSSMASSIYGNHISKAISIGNQIDLNFVDFLEYFL
ncbi:MAG: CoA-binding protein, partial [Candidatus Lokiarchaeota archaeon]|nr:CoA-binding protein [Candidatus Lokiarchaeota archaeon]